MTDAEPRFQLTLREVASPAAGQIVAREVARDVWEPGAGQSIMVWHGDDAMANALELDVEVIGPDTPAVPAGCKVRIALDVGGPDLDQDHIDVHVKPSEGWQATLCRDDPRALEVTATAEVSWPLCVSFDRIVAGPRPDGLGQVRVSLAEARGEPAQEQVPVAFVEVPLCVLVRPATTTMPELPLNAAWVHARDLVWSGAGAGDQVRNELELTLTCPPVGRGQTVGRDYEPEIYLRIPLSEVAETTSSVQLRVAVDGEHEVEWLGSGPGQRRAGWLQWVLRPEEALRLEAGSGTILRLSISGLVRTTVLGGPPSFPLMLEWGSELHTWRTAALMVSEGAPPWAECPSLAVPPPELARPDYRVPVLLTWQARNATAVEVKTPYDDAESVANDAVKEREFSFTAADARYEPYLPVTLTPLENTARRADDEVTFVVPLNYPKVTLSDFTVAPVAVSDHYFVPRSSATPSVNLSWTVDHPSLVESYEITDGQRTYSVKAPTDGRPVRQNLTVSDPTGPVVALTITLTANLKPGPAKSHPEPVTCSAAFTLYEDPTRMPTPRITVPSPRWSDDRTALYAAEVGALAGVAEPSPWPTGMAWASLRGRYRNVAWQYPSFPGHFRLGHLPGEWPELTDLEIYGRGIAGEAVSHPISVRTVRAAALLCAEHQLEWNPGESRSVRYGHGIDDDPTFVYSPFRVRFEADLRPILEPIGDAFFSAWGNGQQIGMSRVGQGRDSHVVRFEGQASPTAGRIVSTWRWTNGSVPILSGKHASIETVELVVTLVANAPNVTASAELIVTIGENWSSTRRPVGALEMKVIRLGTTATPAPSAQPPLEGSFISHGSQTYRIVGGAPLAVDGANLGRYWNPQVVPIGTEQLQALRGQPADGAHFCSMDDGRIFRIERDMPRYVSAWGPEGQQPWVDLTLADIRRRWPTFQ